METIEAILTRRSTRSYKSDPVEQEKLDVILDAARQAPSGGNNQTNHFLVIRNQAGAALAVRILPLMSLPKRSPGRRDALKT